jgi:hypothetical protein
MRPAELTQRWDARWSAPEQAEHIVAADDQIIRARRDLDQLLEEVGSAAGALVQAVKWAVDIRTIQRRMSPDITPTKETTA